MPITLIKKNIDAALPRVEPGLHRYLWLQANRDARDLRSDPEYRRRFNHFYRVRRPKDWQDNFYDLFERQKGKAPQFGEILDALHRATGRYEASFASKLLATIDPEMPVIDRIVLRNLKLRLPAYNSKKRLSQLEELHVGLITLFKGFLITDEGRYLVKRFRDEYPDADITTIKMLDLVLWQTRPAKAIHRTPCKPL